MLNFLTLFLALQAAAYAQLPQQPMAIKPDGALVAQLAQQPIKLDGALVTGAVDGTLIKYLGIPFAQAPRFNLPQAITSYTGNITATAYGPACIQQFNPVYHIPDPQSEDCLSINIIKPAVTNSTLISKLPVLVWIYGGGFQVGSSAQSVYDTLAKDIVSLSIKHDKPLIHVSMNYRLSAYGFLASQEVANEGTGNVGLHDQRVALHWVKHYINAFGGDPAKITLWGESAGSISAAFHMLAYGGKSDDLFHGVFMQSGAPLPVGPIQDGQKYYDDLVTETNCTSSTHINTLECLRHVPLEELRIAVDKSPNLFDYQGLHMAWLPRVDGDFIQNEPYKLIEHGKFVDVPTISSTCDDEGTDFSGRRQLGNISTDADFEDYIRTVWAPGATDDDLLPLWKHYTSIPSEGSPFGEPNDDPPYPQYNRISAFQGDIFFQGLRRLFAKALSLKTQKAWVYLSKRFKEGPRGSYHGSDLSPDFTHLYIVNFVNKFDPNIGNETCWPPYSTTGSELPEILTFLDPQEVVVARDVYRPDAIEYVTNLFLKHPL